MKRSWRIGAFIAISVICITLASYTTAIRQAHAQPEVVALSSASAQTLINFGITLDLAKSAPGVSEQFAKAKAMAPFPEAAEREVVLAQVHTTNFTPNVNRLCWIVSVIPKQGIWSAGANGHRIPLTFQLEFLDAQTGQWLFGVKGALFN